MAYTPVNWVAGVTPLSEANMDHLETQYQELLNLFNAHSILMAVADNDPAALTIAASRIVGRKAAGNIVALTGAEALAITNGINKDTLDANTLLYAVSDNTPAALAMAASTICARLAAGNIKAATPAELMTLLSGSAVGEFLLNTQKIGGVVDPTTDQQVATKNYVDGVALKFVELAGGEGQQNTSSSTWQDWDVSGIVPAGTVSVLVSIEGKGGATAGCRNNGSALARTFSTDADANFRAAGFLQTECDASRIFEIYSSSTANIRFGIMGYWIPIGA